LGNPKGNGSQEFRKATGLEPHVTEGSAIFRVVRRTKRNGQKVGSTGRRGKKERVGAKRRGYFGPTILTD